MNISQIDKKKLVSQTPYVSEYWAKLKDLNGWKNEAYEINKDGFLFQSLVLYKEIIRNNFLGYIPFSPCCVNGKAQLSSKEIKEFLIYISKRSEFKIIFFKVDLPFEYNDNSLFYKDFHLNKESIQPEVTIKLNLLQNLNDIRANYRKRAKRALKKNFNNIVVKQVEPNEDNILLWYNLYLETAKRDHFQTRNFDYIKKIFNIEDNKVQPKLIFAFKQEQLVGGIILLLGKEEALYLFGASKKLDGFSPSYSLQDFAIELTQNAGIKKYDFLGVGTNEKSMHLKTLTLFKSSFGGELYQRVPTLDFPIKKSLYYLFKIVEYIRIKIYR